MTGRSTGGEDRNGAGRGAERARWEDLAREMIDLYPAASTGYYRRCERALVRRAFGELRGRRVLKLDLWNEAFNTRLLPWLCEQGAEAYGIDISAVTCALAGRRAAGEGGGGFRVAQADIRTLPFRDGAFDAVYTMGTIEHVAEYATAVGEVRRVLRPGGRAVIGVPNRHDPFLRPLLVWALERAGCYPYAPERSFSRRQLRALVEGAGLRVREMTGLLTLPGVLRMADLFLLRRGWNAHRVVRPLTRPFEWAETRFPGAARFGYLLAAVVEKPA